VNSERATFPLRAALARALPERPFRVELWDGGALPATNGAVGPTFRLRSPRALGHVLRAPGQLGLGRAYVSGEIEVDDIDALLELLERYTVPPLDTRAKARLAAGAVRAGALRLVPRAPAAELRPRGHAPLRRLERLLRAGPRRVADVLMRDLLPRRADTRGCAARKA
jgi:cyclopropane-fatty-acyl-phospholipid synthase